MTFLFTTKLFLAYAYLFLSQNTDAVPIYTSDEGSDNPMCLHGLNGFNCKTMKYVLEHIIGDNEHASFEIFVENDQHLDNEGINFYFQTSHINELEISGIGLPTVYFSNHSNGILFVGIFHDTHSKIHWSNFNMTGVTEDSAFKFDMVGKVEIQNTFFVNTGGIHTLYVTNVAVISCTFTHMCTSAFVCSDNSKKNLLTRRNHWTIENCVFANNNFATTNTKPIVNFVSQSMKVAIVGCVFNKNRLSQLVSFNVCGNPYAIFNKFQFEKNVITDNTLQLNGISISQTNNSLNTDIYILSNNFSRNKRIQTGSHSLIFTSVQSNSHHYYDYNTFLDNEMPAILIFGACGSKHYLTNSQFIKNVAYESIVAFFPLRVCENQLNVKLYAYSLNFTENSFNLPMGKDIWDPAVFFIEGTTGQKEESEIYLESGNNNFVSNYGTAMSILKTRLVLYGSWTFIGNTGVFGGALLLSLTKLEILGNNVQVDFINNTAKFGGAVYMIDYPCMKGILVNESYCPINGTFTGNTASVEGHSVYSQSPHCKCKFVCGFVFDHEPAVVSGAAYIEILQTHNNLHQHKNSRVFEAFPGIDISLVFKIQDCADTPVSCDAKVLAMCGDENPIPCVRNGFKIKPYGPLFVNLKSGFVNTETKLLISNPSLALHNNLVKLYFQCYIHKGYEVTVTGNISVQVLDCPVGLQYNETSLKCDCMEKSEYFICDPDDGRICIKRGYWLGRVGKDSDSEVIITACNTPYCKIADRQPCPSIVAKDADDFVLLNAIDDLQCIDGHDGISCSICTENMTNSFDTYHCIPSDNCQPWHSWILLIFIISLPILVSVCIIIVVSKLDSGAIQQETGSTVGYFYCPLFYLAVLRQLPFDHLYPELNVAVKFYVSTYLLDGRVFGLIPWCFFPLSPMWNVAFYFIGPLIICLVLVSTVYLARFCPRPFLSVQNTPVKSMCLLFMLSFWSLSETSVYLIAPTSFSHVDGVRLAIQPDHRYFQGGHIPLVMVSLIIITVLSILSILLLISPVCRGKLAKVKPFLDEFQLCYKKKYHWYAGVYFCSWVLLQILIVLQWNLILQSLVVIIGTAQVLLHPYNNKWSNKIDSLLLTDLMFLIAVLNDKYNETGMTSVVIVYLLVILPLLYITGGTLYILLKRSNIAAKYIIRKCIEQYRVRGGDHNLAGNSSTSTDIIENPQVTSTIIEHPRSVFECPQNFYDPQYEREPLLFHEESSFNSTSS